MIPIASPKLGDEEKRLVLEVLESTQLTNGGKTRELEKSFAGMCGTKHGIATNSGTGALHTALVAAGVKRGDEVIIPAFTFIASANAVAYCGAKPVFVDMDGKTYNMSVEDMERKITEKTKAVMPVHLYGLPAKMDEILRITKEHDLAVVEDACQAHGADIGGKKVGSFGDFGCFSFYPTKNMTTCEGGMITTNDDEKADMCRALINQGMKERYKHLYLGFNYRMTEFSAAVGIGQLKRLGGFTEARRKNAKFYDGKLSGKFITPHTPKGYGHVYHQYTVRTDNRDSVIRGLKERGIGFGIYYPTTIPQQPVYDDIGEYPVAEKACKEVLSIPVHPALTQDQLEEVASTLLEAIE
ncbi:MAG: DegT/DnrJ/EryC1/StrS family aminotransferase [Candidatus Micrarchaeota archaeon]